MGVPGQLLILVFLGLSLGVKHNVAQGLQTAAERAEQLLNQTEVNLREFVTQVESNAQNACDLLSTCNATSTCSRLSCSQFATREHYSGYGCLGVMKNTNCRNNCSTRSFDFTQSFLRVAGLERYNITERQLLGICAQRMLDPFFRTISNSTDFFRVFFGSVDGTLRLFPGADEPDCSSYDPRPRLWYLTSTKVKKAVMVLLDRGSSMTKTYSATGNDNRLAGASDVAKAFLDTTTQDDYVNIFLFDHATVEPLSEKAVRVTNENTHPDFGNLTAALDASNQKPASTVETASNATNAIIEAIRHVGINTDITSEYLKVIIVITDGKFVNATRDVPLPWDLIKKNNMNLFVYIYPPTSSTIIPSDFGQQFCIARGHFEKMEETASQNPLLTLQAYYSFLANIHSSFKENRIDYSTQHVDYTEVDNRTFTLSKAAFSSNSELLGVAAIHIFKSKLLQAYNIDGDAIEGAVKRRTNPEISFNASRDLNTPTCLNQTLNTCKDSPSYSNIVCPSNSERNIMSLSSLSCCGVCEIKDGSRELRRNIGAGVGGGIVGLLLLCVAGFFIHRKCREIIEIKRIKDANMPSFPGSPLRRPNYSQ